MPYDGSGLRGGRYEDQLSSERPEQSGNTA